MRYNRLMGSTHLSVRDLNLPPDFWESKEVELNDRKLDSLDGCPDEIPGHFACWGNPLTSLAGGPRIVGDRFNCSGNKLTSLAHAPKTVGGDFDCSDNLLTSLEHAPTTILGGGFGCLNNQLTSLDHAPKIVGGSFRCSGNLLTSLAHAPKIVGYHFNCTHNHLTSLADIHTHVRQIKGNLYIGGNPITSHILGILLIQGCVKVIGASLENLQFHQAVEILNKYLAQGRAGIMDCQAEMIAHGLDEFAQI